ncbi:MAG: hypothetical protein ACRDQI_08900 [Pseudonocardiaceae bacterium]
MRAIRDNGHGGNGQAESNDKDEDDPKEVSHHQLSLDLNLKQPGGRPMPQHGKTRLPHWCDRAMAPQWPGHRSTPTPLTTLNQGIVINLGRTDEHPCGSTLIDLEGRSDDHEIDDRSYRLGNQPEFCDGWYRRR